MTQQRVSPISVTSVLPATVTLSVQGALGQSANLIEARNNAGAIVFSVTSGGAFGQQVTAAAGVDVVGGSLGLRSIAGAASVVPIVSRGAVSQTAALQRWEESTGTVLTQITSTGDLVGSANFGLRGRYILSVANTGAYLDTNLVSNALAIVQRVAGNIALIIRGAASQTANLFEAQNNAGSVLVSVQSGGGVSFPNASISVGGVIRGVQLGTNNDYVRIAQSNSGGQVGLTKQTAASTNPGADIGTLYFRDGTNAGTLKLVVRAGAAGAETTILDNIPQ